MSFFSDKGKCGSTNSTPSTEITSCRTMTFEVTNPSLTTDRVSATIEIFFNQTETTAALQPRLCEPPPDSSYSDHHQAPNFKLAESHKSMSGSAQLLLTNAKLFFVKPRLRFLGQTSDESKSAADMLNNPTCPSEPTSSAIREEWSSPSKVSSKDDDINSSIPAFVKLYFPNLKSI
jgi:hypothetical protein